LGVFDLVPWDPRTHVIRQPHAHKARQSHAHNVARQPHVHNVARQPHVHSLMHTALEHWLAASALAWSPRKTHVELVLASVSHQERTSKLRALIGKHYVLQERASICATRACDKNVGRAQKWSMLVCNAPMTILACLSHSNIQTHVHASLHGECNCWNTVVNLKEQPKLFATGRKGCGGDGWSTFDDSLPSLPLNFLSHHRHASGHDLFSVSHTRSRHQLSSDQGVIDAGND
jgi:hypothetical protein